MATPVLERILAARTVEDDQGNLLPLHSGISANEGECISACIERHKISRTLEVGCAYGVSSLYICEALSRQPNPRHIMIDPVESTVWRNIGVLNLRRAGFEFWELIEQPSELALPSLLKQGLKVQFVLIDGSHTFDQVLVDFFFVDRLLEDGGIVAFDDADMAAIHRVVRYILNYPNYRLLESVKKPYLPTSLKRQTFAFVMRRLTNALPPYLQEEYFNSSWLAPAEALGVAGSFVLLQKSGPDARNWDWYRHF
jgi:predicted O-methyltransferase YrrM